MMRPREMVGMVATRYDAQILQTWFINSESFKRGEGERARGEGEFFKLRPKDRASEVMHQGIFGIGAAKKAIVPHFTMIPVGIDSCSQNVRPCEQWKLWKQGNSNRN